MAKTWILKKGVCPQSQYRNGLVKRISSSTTFKDCTFAEVYKGGIARLNTLAVFWALLWALRVTNPHQQVLFKEMATDLANTAIPLYFFPTLDRLRNPFVSLRFEIQYIYERLYGSMFLVNEQKQRWSHYYLRENLKTPQTRINTCFKTCLS